jgi:hypothetical protein
MRIHLLLLLLPFIHFGTRQSYLTFEAIFFSVCLVLALVNVLWIGPVLFFL